MSIKRRGVCTACGREMTIIAQGLCSACYLHRAKGLPTVDCFALDPHVSRGQCGVMEGNCRLHKGQPCPFHRTVNEYAESRRAAIRRIQSLPLDVQAHIAEKYYDQRGGAE